jgi:hypothetical protein
MYAEDETDDEQQCADHNGNVHSQLGWYHVAHLNGLTLKRYSRYGNYWKDSRANRQAATVTKMIPCQLWLCGSTLRALLAASPLLGFHSLPRALGTTHKRVGGFFLRSGHRFAAPNEGAPPCPCIFASTCALETFPFATFHHICVRRTKGAHPWREEK